MGKPSARFTSHLFMQLRPAQGGDIIEEGCRLAWIKGSNGENAGEAPAGRQLGAHSNETGAPHPGNSGQNPGE